MNFNFSFPTEYIVIALAALVLYLIYYIFSKEAQYTKHIRSVATAVEEQNREIFFLRQKLEETQKGIKENSYRMSDEEVYQEIERSVYDMVKPLSLEIKNIQSNIEAIDVQVDTRISSLESGVKQISLPASVHGNDDEKIISLFKQGVSLDTISKELHLSKPEVEFVLKINKIK